MIELDNAGAVHGLIDQGIDLTSGIIKVLHGLVGRLLVEDLQAVKERHQQQQSQPHLPIQRHQNSIDKDDLNQGNEDLRQKGIVKLIAQGLRVIDNAGRNLTGRLVVKVGNGQALHDSIGPVAQVSRHLVGTGHENPKGTIAKEACQSQQTDKEGQLGQESPLIQDQPLGHICQMVVD